MDVSKERAQTIAENKIRRKDIAALRYLMADERGRWFAMRLFEQCHMVQAVPFSEGNVNRLLVSEGERRVGLVLLSNMEALGVLNEKQQAEREYYAFMRQMKELIQSAEQKEV